MIGIGIVGLGKMGRVRADVVEATGRGRLVAVFEPNGHGDSEYRFVESPQEVFADPEVDAVFVCTPNHLNRPLTIEALEAGKHVFCEKPPAFTAVEVEEIRSAEARSGKLLMYGFNHRHHSSIKHMKSLVDSGEFGDVLWMRGRYGKSVDEGFYEQWRANPELAGGGILLDQGIHMLDLFLHLGGAFDEVEAFVSNLYWQMGIEDNVFAIFRNSRSGTVASLHSTMTQWRHLFSLEVFLSKGYLVLNGLRTSSGTYGEEVLSVAKNRSTAPAATWEDEEKITYHENTSWRSEVEHFLDSIERGAPVAVGNSLDALELMKLVDAVYAKGRKK
jgi:1,5-anhydro-D-fructose reductase (1,5-anhydro-D-mannitol-forming)